MGGTIKITECCLLQEAALPEFAKALMQAMQQLSGASEGQFYQHLKKGDVEIVGSPHLDEVLLPIELLRRAAPAGTRVLDDLLVLDTHVLRDPRVAKTPSVVVNLKSGRITTSALSPEEQAGLYQAVERYVYVYA
jgi:hypothetical protein